MSSNPYQTPTGQLQTDEDQAFGEISFLNPSCRINRLRYWAHSLVLILGILLVSGIMIGIVSLISPMLSLVFVGIMYVAIIVCSFIVTIQRLHDMNYSGWLSILLIIPLVSLVLWIMLIAVPSTPGRNNYGLPPPPNQTWHWVAGLAMPILSVIAIIGILAAVSIPAYKDYIDRAQAAQEATYDSETSASDENYYGEETTDDAQATEGEYYESDAAETSESESYDTEAEAEVESMTEDETTEENSAQ